MVCKARKNPSFLKSLHETESEKQQKEQKAVKAITELTTNEIAIWNTVQVQKYIQ